jgi:hypothetical protein
MASQLDGVKAVVTVLLGMITDILAVIMANPVLIIPIAAGLIGTGIMVFKKIKG